ncbi:hypothetical protein LINPERPRIM_LOCUS35667 [Linum perenne]
MKGSPLLRIYPHSQIGRLRLRRGTLLCLHTRLPFSESSAGPPTTSLQPEAFIANDDHHHGQGIIIRYEFSMLLAGTEVLKTL